LWLSPVEVPNKKQTRESAECPCEEELRKSRFSRIIALNANFSKDLRMSDLDAIDLAIMRTLQDNGRISNADLAQRVGLSPSACSRRLDLLEKSGTISGYHARLSNKALDYKMMVIVHISLSGQFAKTLAEFEAAVKLCPNILVCYLMSGEYDYILRVAAKDLEDYERIHRDWLSALPHVVKINSSFALREIIDRPNVGL